MHCFGDKIISIFDLRYILSSYSIISLDTQKTIMKVNSPQMNAADALGDYLIGCCLSVTSTQLIEAMEFNLSEILSGSADTKLNN